jgi:hypothetical protein
MRTRVRTALSVAVLFAAAAVSGCNGNKAENEPAVATPTLTLNKDRVAIGSAVTLTYKFVVEPSAKFDKDYWVFVHVLDPEGEQMWTDDHQPPKPTTQWKPGETIEYKRTIFVPNYPYIGQAIVRLGLYDLQSGKRLVLKAEEKARREYVVAKFQILGSTDNITMMRRDGWYPGEVDQKNPQMEWMWSKKAGTVSFKNPKKDSTLYIRYAGRPDLFQPAQQVVIKLGDQIIGQFAADAKLPTILTFPITAAQLGAGELTDLTFEVDKTFKPGGGDPRELGVQIFNIYVEPK